MLLNLVHLGNYQWRRSIFLLLFLCSFFVLQAQEYEIELSTHVKYDNNNVSCDSWFNIILEMDGGENYYWFENLDMSEGQWRNHNRIMSFPASRKVRKIIVRSKRETSDCTTRGSGERELVIDDASYPCFDSGPVDGMFAGYDGASDLTVSIRPLSLTRVLIQQNAIQTESYIKVSGDVPYFEYTVSAVYTDNSTETILSRDPHSVNGGSEFRNQLSIIRSRKIIDEIRVTSRKMENPLAGPTSVTRIFDVDDTGADFDVRLDETSGPNPPFAYVNPASYLHIRFNQPKTPILYSPGTSNILPSANLIDLEVQENSSSFQWKYSTNNGATFANLPSAFGTGKKISISGEALFGANWQNFLFRNIQFKAVYSCASPELRETKVITLVHLPSAPGIHSTDQVTESCAGYGDGKLKIKFKRPLYTFNYAGEDYKERVYAFLQRDGDLPPGETHEIFPNSLDADNALFIENQPGNTYHISLLTSFVKVSDESVSLGNGYSEGADHFATQILPARPPITNFLYASSDVHCFDGADGIINVSAAGGTGIYDSYLVSGIDTLQHINLTEFSSNNFINVTAGNYSVRLQDSNGCDVKDGSNNIIVHSVLINQPVEGTLLSAVESVEPRGFGLTDGHIIVRSEGGTMPFSFGWKDGNNISYSPEPSVIEGESMTSKLSSIGKGTYHILAKDDQYDLVTVRTELNLRGCYDTLTVNLDEPPLLEVYMDQYHFVSCYGYDDGELVAHAKGGRPYVSGHTYDPYQYEWFSVNGGLLTAFGISDSIATDRPSALYRVKVTDRNGIIAWSPDFTLIQPDLLTIAFTTSELLCNGDSNGTSAATVQGGTPVYQYAWSTEETSPSVSNLTDGWYSLIVKDTRGCTTFGQTEVKVPNSLEAEGAIVYPTCNGYNDGSINLSVTGGQTPYNYAWSQGGNVAAVTELGEGNYNVTITDANGCFIHRDFLLDDPELLNIDLGADRVLCKDQTLPLNASINDPLAQYQWTKNGVGFATSPTVDLVESGTYAITITDSKGCLNTDDISITRNEAEISSSITVASRAPVGERVRIANISYPFPERVEWIIPSQAQVLDENSGFLDLLFNEKKEYTIGMISYVGSCEKVSYTTVKIVDKSELKDYQTPGEPYIKQFMVSPNPNNGKFTATIELREIGDVTLSLLTPQGTVLTTENIKQQSFIRKEFDVTGQVGNGMYVLQLVTAQGYSTFKVAIQK